MSYHLITEGRCWAQLANNQGSAIYLNAGELLVVPQGEAHVIGSDLALSPASAAPLLASQLQTSPGQVMTLLMEAVERAQASHLPVSWPATTQLEQSIAFLRYRLSSRSTCATIRTRHGLRRHCNSRPPSERMARRQCDRSG